MKKLFTVALIVVFLLFGSSVGIAQATLYINEFSSATTNSDWIEIYNSDSSSVELSGYSLHDSSSNKLDLSGTITGNGYIVFDWSNRLNNGGDEIQLQKPDLSEIDKIVYGGGGAVAAPSGTQTAGRQTDGSSSWVIFENDSRGSSNNSTPVVPTPTPTPTPTNTPTPTSKPANTPTPTPAPAAATSTPTPTKKVTTSPTPKPPTIETATNEAQMMHTTAQTQPQQEVKGSSIELGGKLDDLDKKETQYNWAKLLILMGAVLVTCACGILVYNSYLKDKLEEMRAQ